MKTLYKIFFLFFILQGLLFSQWAAQSSGTVYALKSVQFLNENTGLACCYNTIIKTTNGGSNWQSIPLQGNHNMLKFTDSNTGYVCSDSGKVYKTVNAGLNWTLLNSNVANNLTSISFINSETGIATGYGKTIIKTTNGGLSWVNIANFVWQIDLLGSKMINSSIYYVTGSESFIMKTTDGGSSWSEYTHGEVNPLFTVEFVNQQTGWATGCCGMFMSTTDGGQKWNQEYYLTLGFTLRSLKFVNSLTGYTVGDNGGIYRTTNGGLWWDSTVTNTLETLYSIHMINENTGWVVGGYGTIYKTTNGGGTGFTIGVNQLSSNIPVKFLLYQNYPNPFNPGTKIKFDIPSGKAGVHSSIKVYDALGKEVSTLFESELATGTYEVIFNASKYPSGIYFYRLKYGDYSESRKMILIK